MRVDIPTVAAAEATAAPAGGSASLTTTVQFGQPTSDALTMRFTARNTSSSTLHVLSRDLPQARQSGAILTVTRDGVPVPYRGRMVKPATPSAADYTRIPAGGTYAVTDNLADDYDLSRPGAYTAALAFTRVRAMRAVCWVRNSPPSSRTRSGDAGAFLRPRRRVHKLVVAAQVLGLSSQCPDLEPGNPPV